MASFRKKGPCADVGSDGRGRIAKRSQLRPRPVAAGASVPLRWNHPGYQKRRSTRFMWPCGGTAGIFLCAAWVDARAASGDETSDFPIVPAETRSAPEACRGPPGILRYALRPQARQPLHRAPYQGLHLAPCRETRSTGVSGSLWRSNRWQHFRHFCDMAR